MKTGMKWLTGCGISLGVVVLTVVILVAGGIGWYRSTISSLEESEQSQVRLESELGGMDAYTPPPDGIVSPDRLEVFLAIRTTLQPWHSRMTEHLSAYPPAEDGPVRLGPMRQLRIATGMGGFFSDLGEYLETRNGTLLGHGMGLGEYFYIHALVYHWWLGHDPIDGPELLHGLEHEDGVNIQFFDDDTTFGKSESRRRYRLKVRRMLGRQLAALEADPGPAPEGWRDALAAELSALESDPGRIPWRDGLPEHLAAWLEPHRERCEEAYCPLLNLFDLHDATGGDRY